MLANYKNAREVIIANATPEFKKTIAYGNKYGCPPWTMPGITIHDYDVQAFKKPRFKVVGDDVSVFVKIWGGPEQRVDYQLKKVKGKYLIDDLFSYSWVEQNAKKPATRELSFKTESSKKYANCDEFY